ncbi:MAG: YfhO family protein [Vicinamibacteria bacterium]
MSEDPDGGRGRPAERRASISRSSELVARRDIGALLLILAMLEMAMRGPVLLGVVALYQRDLMLVYFPLIQVILREVSLGAFPLRDPTSAFGQPLLADPSCQILYPPTWLHILLPPPLAYGWFVSIHSVFGALGVALLARRLSSGSFLSGLIGGVAWQMSGPLLSLATLWHHMAGAAWIPWVWLAVERALARCPGRTDLALGVAMGAQMLAGSAEMCAATLMIATLRILLAKDRSLWRPWLTSGLWAVALSAGVWLPAAEMVLNSARSALPEAARTFWSLSPISVFEFFLPIPLSAFPLAAGWQGALFEGREPFLASMFLGAPILPLCLAGLADSSLSRSARAAGFLGMAGAVLTALGKNAVFYSWLVTFVPVLKIFRYPSKAMIPAAVLICVWAGVGVASVRRTRRSRRTAWAGALGLSLSALTLLCYLQPIEREFMDPLRAAGIVEIYRNLPGDLLWTLGLLGLLGGYMSVRSPWVSLTLLALLAAGQLRQSLVLHDTLNPVVPMRVLSYRPEFLDLMKPPPEGRIYVYDYAVLKSRRVERYMAKNTGAREWERVRGLEANVASLVKARTYLSPLVGAFWNVEYAWDADMRMLFDRRLAELTLAVRGTEETPAFLRLLQVSGVERMISLHDQGLTELTLLAREEFGPRALRIFAVPDPLPRAFLVSGRQRGSGHDLRDLTDPEFDPRTSVVVDRDPVRTAVAGFEGVARILDQRSDRIRVQTRANGPAFLTVIEGALPGWRAWIDGRPAPVERANAVFIGTEVPAGDHRVEFRFLPSSAVIGVFSSALTCLLLCALLLRARVTERVVKPVSANPPGSATER